MSRWMMACLLLCGLAGMLHAAEAPALPEALRTNLIGWFDAADDAAFTLDGQSVVTWKDKSGQGHHLAQENADSRPQRVKIDDCSVVQSNGNRTMLAPAVKQSLEAMTVYALVKAPPSYTPIIAFRTDNKTEFCAVGWTVGARPTLFAGKGSRDACFEVEDNQWHLLAFVRNGAERRFYVDGVPAGTATGDASPSEMTDYLLFAYSTATTFNGSLAELLIYKTAHDAAQVKQASAYLYKKWAPLFPAAKSDLVAFIGNSITTGMYCGNGKTWSAQAAAGLPGLTRWYNISRGGITTQGLAALAADSVDPLLAKTTGRSVLVFWEGTNDLVVNHADAAAAHEAIKQYCLARRKAGWGKIVVLTVLPRDAGGDFEQRRQALNALLREHYKEYADALADVAANPEIGDDSDQKNTTCYADGVHTTAKGNAIVAGVVIPVLKELLPAK